MWSLMVRFSGEVRSTQAAGPDMPDPPASRRTAGWQWRAKRLLDMLVAGILLIALAPLFALIAVAIRLTTSGPVLYRWPVLGEGGRPLRAYKFRTMIVGADALKLGLRERNEASGPVFKMRNDPRITPVGRVLRKFGLDELPQLWSVLRGEMSLVGPRPVLVSEWVQMNAWQRRKLSTKPGIVCLWHLRGQPRDFDEWVRLDLEYVDNWSLWLDLKLLFWTPFYVLSGKNY
jgi:lipopolysaccharide/colanic/teichoic acid biosynthesis glycosyltransferase